MYRLRSRFLMAAVAAVVWIGTAAADSEGVFHSRDRGIGGNYGMTLSQTCVLAPIQPPPAMGFDPDTGSLLTDAETVSAVSHGIVKFHRNGKVAIRQGVLTEIFHNRVTAGEVPVVAGNQYGCDGQYDLRRNGRIEVSLTCEVQAPSPDIKITIAPFELDGFVSQGREHINLTAAEGNVQLFELAIQGQAVQQRERVCIQSLSLARLPSRSKY